MQTMERTKLMTFGSLCFEIFISILNFRRRRQADDEEEEDPYPGDNFLNDGTKGNNFE